MPGAVLFHLYDKSLIEVSLLEPVSGEEIEA